MYLASLVSIDSSAGEGKRAQSMQQLAWFPPGRAQPGWTPARETRQSHMRDLAALDLKQASQFAAFQAFSTSLIWRGIVLVLVYTCLHGTSSPSSHLHPYAGRRLSTAGCWNSTCLLASNVVKSCWLVTCTLECFAPAVLKGAQHALVKGKSLLDVLCRVHDTPS